MYSPEMIQQMVAMGAITPQQAQQLAQQQTLLDYGTKPPQQTTSAPANNPAPQPAPTPAPQPAPNQPMTPMPTMQGASGTNKGASAVSGAANGAAVGTAIGGPGIGTAIGAGVGAGASLLGDEGGPSALEKKNLMLQYKQNKLNYKSNLGKYADQMAHAFGMGIEGIGDILRS